MRLRSAQRKVRSARRPRDVAARMVVVESRRAELAFWFWVVRNVLGLAMLALVVGAAYYAFVTEGTTPFEELRRLVP